MCVLRFLMPVLFTWSMYSQTLEVTNSHFMTPGGVARPIKQILVDSAANYIIHYMD